MKKEFSQDTYFYNVLDAIKEAQNSNDFNLDTYHIWKTDLLLQCR